MPLGLSHINSRQYIRKSKAITNGGGATISSTQSKFGGTSAAFSIASSNSTHYLSIANATTSPDLNFGSGNFTVECWIWPAQTGAFGTGAPYILDSRASTSDTSNLGIYYNASNQLALGGFLSNASTTTMSLNAWHHIALVRSGSNTFNLYLDGTSVISTTSTNTMSGNIGWYIGRGLITTTQCYRGYIDEVRFSNIARYTTTFTPPTTRFQHDGNTVFLLHADGVNAATTFSEDCGTG